MKVYRLEITVWMRRYAHMLVMPLLLMWAACAEPDRTVFEPPVQPRDAIRTMEVAGGFKVELFASEPLVADPVAMEIDEFGRMFVLEMPGYPLDTAGTGRVRLLRDTTGDGFPDESAIFADGLVLPKGIMRWRDGLLVADAPHLYYLEDSTGDGQADVREIVLTGFARSNPQHNFNKPLYGLDNWIYLANGGTVWTETYTELFGDRGSPVHFAGNPEGPVLPQNAGGRNVRFRPDSHDLEMLSSWTQFGHDFDAWGRHFLISNANHHFHEAIAARYAERNPVLPLRSAIHYTPVHGNAAEVFPVTHNPEHQLLTDIGVMTSASGITWYLGGAFGEEFENVTFVAESVHNLVHADRVVENGAVFEAHRVLEDSEFLASTDSWFRPVNFYVGPDGALYVIDYYRHVIEHPQWMDDEAIATMDLYAGADHGRIYRISREDAPAPAWLNDVNLGEAPVEELVAQLENANMWWRRNAQRLIVDRQDEQAVNHLELLAVESTIPEARLHAIWSLEGLHALTSDFITSALNDPEPGVRENAIRLVELHMDRDTNLLDELPELARDSSARVRYQLLLTLGFHDSPEARELRRQLLFDDIEDPWVQIAALSAHPVRDARFLDRTIEELAYQASPGRQNYFRHVGAMVAATESIPEIRNLIQRTAGDVRPEDTWWQSAALAGMADQLGRSDLDLAPLTGEQGMLLASFFQSENGEMRRAALSMIRVTGLPPEATQPGGLDHATALASDPDADEELRTDAVALLGLADASEHEDLLRKLIHPGEASSVQRAALQVLADVPSSDIGEYVLARWERMTPEVRDEAVNVLMTEEDRVEMLLDAVEDNRVLVSTIGWGRRVALMRDWSGDIRDRARELLSEDPAAGRAAIEEYRSALNLAGDAARGRRVFADNCAPCHQTGGQDGVPFGPDIGTVRHWTPQALMSKILDPNRAIADGFEMWLVERESGGSVSGVISAETVQAVTLRNAGGTETTIPRSDIASITASNVSAMPTGMEQQISEQEMADLIEFIRRGGR